MNYKTKAKLAESVSHKQLKFGQSKASPKITKQRKVIITEKPNNISILLIKKGVLTRVLICLGFRTCILLMYRKTTSAKTKK